jgi:hypothetical protein
MSRSSVPFAVALALVCAADPPIQSHGELATAIDKLQSGDSASYTLAPGFSMDGYSGGSFMAGLLIDGGITVTTKGGGAVIGDGCAPSKAHAILEAGLLISMAHWC